jgi:quercetin dioxygenase-like cupin family protein
MRKVVLAAALLAFSFPICAVADEHVVAQPDGLKWGAAPPALPAGAQIAVLSGDPTKEVPYVVRLKLPAGYKVPAHTHPNDESVTVISGGFNIGMGATLDQSKGTLIKAGGYGLTPKGMQHFAWFTEETVIQIHGLGPFAITYVNPADDPRNKK